MKFFTPQACATFDDPEAFQRVDRAYRDHLRGLRGRLDEAALRLAEPAGFENGLVTRIKHGSTSGRLEITLRCGHLKMGYFNLTLTYEGAEMTPDDAVLLARIAQTTLVSRTSTTTSRTTNSTLPTTNAWSIVSSFVLPIRSWWTRRNGCGWRSDVGRSVQKQARAERVALRLHAI